MNHVLLVFDVLGEGASLYKLQVDDETFEKLSQCRGKYGGIVDSLPDDLYQWLSDFVVAHEASKIGLDSPLFLDNGWHVIVTGYVL